MAKIKNLKRLLGDWVELEVLDHMLGIGRVKRVGHDAKHIRVGEVVCFCARGYWPTVEEQRPEEIVIVRDDELVAEAELVEEKPADKSGISEDLRPLEDLNSMLSGDPRTTSAEKEDEPRA